MDRKDGNLRKKSAVSSVAREAILTNFISIVATGALAVCLIASIAYWLQFCVRLGFLLSEDPEVLGTIRGLYWGHRKSDCRSLRVITLGLRHSNSKKDASRGK